MSGSVAVDYLSHCSSLFDILSLLEWKDISNCVLVNHRLLSFVIGNQLYRRIPVKFEILSEVSEDNSLDLLCIKLRAKEERVLFFITNSGITMVTKYGSSPSDTIWAWTVQALLANGSPCVGETADDKLVSSKILERKVNRIHGPWHFSHFENESIETGLRILLSLLFRRYRLHRLIIGRWRDNSFSCTQRRLVINASGNVEGSVFPEHLYDVVKDEFRRGNCRCDALEVDQPFHEIERFCNTLDCTEVYVYCASDLDSLLDNIETWDRCYMVDIPQMTLDTFRSVLRLVQRYMAGQFNINCLLLLHRRRSGEHFSPLSFYEITETLNARLIAGFRSSSRYNFDSSSFISSLHFSRAGPPFSSEENYRLTVSYTHIHNEYNMIRVCFYPKWYEKPPCK